MSKATKVYFAIITGFVIVLSILLMTNVIPSNMTTAVIILISFPVVRFVVQKLVIDYYEKK